MSVIKQIKRSDTSKGRRQKGVDADETTEAKTYERKERETDSSVLTRSARSRPEAALKLKGTSYSRIFAPRSSLLYNDPMCAPGHMR